MIKRIPKLVQTDVETFEFFIKELHKDPELTVGDTYDAISPNGNVIARYDIPNDIYYVWNGEYKELDTDKQRKKAEDLALKIVEALKYLKNC